jgi:hypothetical protein
VILDYFIEGFKARFPERELLVRTSDIAAVIPAANSDIGKLEVQRDQYDDEELIVYVGDITHGHFNCYEDELSSEEKQRRVANSVLDFLDSVFTDRVEFYGSREDGGGWRLRGSTSDSDGLGKTFIWSGHQ